MNEHLDTLATTPATVAPSREAPAAEHKAEEAQGKGNLFAELLHHTQDAHEIEFPGGHLALPYILLDTDGLHVYRSGESLQEAGTYTLTEKETPLRADTHAAPMIDLSLTKHIVFMWVAAVILILVAVRAARSNTKRVVATGVGNMMEVVIVFVRDEIILPNMGPDGLRYLPYLLTTFFFILVMNLLGLIPYGSTATGNVNVTAGLAVIAFIMIQYSAIRAQGIGHYLAHLTGGVHWLLWPIMIPIEILGLFTKPFALCIRLFANMTGGHIVIVSLIGLIFIFQSFLVALAPVGFVVGIMLLEIFVAFLQAYIFTMLTSLFMGLGMQAESHESHGSAH
ncbi:MAG TPA: F0F1 ATP synthase subunit A [Bacteroidota bacterium]|nr:F0F1 ATP synthase subunit A [Bacteroidota bacterium]